ncbi:hypothetical protein [Bdellovibrio svalbardensis]|uniref:Peptidase C39-like domain-containing protein n=1 Tax=Bdellovibrio svalbardensis TaxID=2972972 RepID=A0ABT6DP15_9BACT|nr:hypothetical protein [Bdellovibrio svalbardensis]MDG0816873.1 hypothetical protein [Bdellovibrio svalbardensis]
MSKVLLLLGLLFSSSLYAAYTDIDPSSFLNQEDQRLAQAQLIEPNQPSSLCGPTTLANLLQILAFEMKGRTIPAQTFVNAMAKSQQESLLKDIDVRKGLTSYEFVNFADVFLKKFNVQIKWTKQHASSAGGIDLETLLSPEPSVLMLRYSDRRSVAPMPRGPGRRDPRFSPPMDPGGYAPEEDFLVGFHYVLKVHADKEQGLLWLIDPADPSHWTIVKIRTGFEGASNQELIFLVPQNPEDLKKGAPVGRVFRWSVSENLIPTF